MMRRYTTLCIAMVAFLSGTAMLRAQHPGWTLYADGNDILSMVEAGPVLWLGTGGGGLIRFDKESHQRTIYTKQNSPLPDNWIRSMALDSTGRLWVGTRRGVAMLDGEVWRVIDTTSAGGDFPSILSIAAARDGAIWAVFGGNLAGGDLARLDADKPSFDMSDWTIYREQNGTFPVTLCTCVAVAPDGTVWVGTNEHDLVRSSDTGWVVRKNGEYVSTIEIGRGGDVWVSENHTGVVARIDGDSMIYYRLPEPMVYDFGLIYSISDQGTGRVFIGTSQGTAVLEKDTMVPWPADPPGHPIYSIVSGSGDSLWIGSDWGISFYDGATWSRYETSETGLPTNTITAVLIDGDEIWGGIRDGVVHYDGERWTSYAPGNSGLVAGDIEAIVKDSSGTIWVATNAGLASFDGTEWHAIPRGDIYGDVGFGPRDLAVAPDGTLWIAGVGLAKYDGTSFTVYNPENSPLPTINTTAVEVDDRGGVWVGSSALAAGLTRFHQGEWTIYLAGKSKLPYDRIGALASDGNGGVWVGSAGIARCDGSDWSSIYNSSNAPMKSVEVHAMTTDRSGALWFSTNDGLYRFDGKGWGHFTTRNSGLPALAILALASDTVGNIWISVANGGLVRYDARVTTGVNERPTDLDRPTTPALDVAPNPMKETAMVTFSSASRSHARLMLVDPLGRVASKLLDRDVAAGPCSVPFDASRVLPGVYFLRLEIDGRATTRAVVVGR